MDKDVIKLMKKVKKFAKKHPDVDILVAKIKKADYISASIDFMGKETYRSYMYDDGRLELNTGAKS